MARGACVIRPRKGEGGLPLACCTLGAHAQIVVAERAGGPRPAKLSPVLASLGKVKPMQRRCGALCWLVSLRRERSRVSVAELGRDRSAGVCGALGELEQGLDQDGEAAELGFEL